MHRALIATLAVSLIAAAAAAFATTASSSGHTAEQLMNAGWECVTPPGDNVHCTKAIEELGTAPRVTFRVFHVVTGEFLGTEMLVHVDVFKGEPCPTDPPSQEYTDLRPILGLPYFACHRYDSPF
jgi:hypothetical protein